jgi:hypothetical protein
VNALHSELKNASQAMPVQGDVERIRRGRSTWFRGKPAHGPDGTVALALSDDAKIIIDDRDVLTVEKNGAEFEVEVKANADVLLRIDKLLSATPDCCDRGHGPNTMQKPDKGGSKPGDLEMEVVEVCDLVCGDFILAGIRFPVCIPVNCKKM